jgi:hypothetical protein
LLVIVRNLAFMMFVSIRRYHRVWAVTTEAAGEVLSSASGEFLSMTPMDDAVGKMARHCFAYGRWDAPYWFIGPEPGQRRVENGDLRPRLNAWVKLGWRELCDCEQFHREIDEHAWHRDGKLQSTWKRLIRLLIAFLEQPTDIDTLRNYRRKQWGIADGQTCVIELSGLVANNLTIPRDRQSSRQRSPID